MFGAPFSDQRCPLCGTALVPHRDEPDCCLWCRVRRTRGEHALPASPWELPDVSGTLLAAAFPDGLGDDLAEATSQPPSPPDPVERLLRSVFPDGLPL